LPRGIRKSFRQRCQKLPEDLRDGEHDVLRLTTDLRIAPTSNQAESDLRPAKTQEKISGRLRSEDTTRHRYAIRGYISNRRQAPGLRPHAMRDAFLATRPHLNRPSSQNPRSQHGPECLHRNADGDAPDEAEIDAVVADAMPTVSVPAPGTGNE
jgi:Transposase IS66 family